MDKLSRLSTSISIPIPKLLLIPRSLEAAICRGSRPKLYNIYQQKRVYSSQEALIAESERLYVCNESCDADNVSQVARILKDHSPPFYRKPANRQGSTSSSSTSYWHETILLWVIRLRLEVKEDRTLEIAGVTEGHSALENKTSGNQLRQLTDI